MLLPRAFYSVLGTGPAQILLFVAVVVVVVVVVVVAAVVFFFLENEEETEANFVLRLRRFLLVEQ